MSQLLSLGTLEATHHNWRVCAPHKKILHEEMKILHAAN